jgi:diadenosine tetraphosphate (Ap4A) HIT family hydrolase
MTTDTPCPLCQAGDERVLWRNALLRVILVADKDYPAFCRVIWNAHVREMSDLDATGRGHFMHVVFAVERALRASLSPDKINLASLGNQAPHLHWHVIPRFADDAHFPDPVWAARRRAGHAHPVDEARLAAAVAREAEVGQSN